MCEGHYVKMVMIDGGSGGGILLATLQTVKINANQFWTNNVCVRAFDGEK